jgi:hypothetical protein
MKPQTHRGTIRELEKDVQKEVRKALGCGCSLVAKGRAKHSKLVLPNGVSMPIPAQVRLLRSQLRKVGLYI